MANVTARHPFARARLFIYGGLLVAALVLNDGWVCHAIGAAGLLLALALQLAERPQFYRLSMVWQGVFVLMICGEGLLEGDAIAFQYGRDIYNEASRYLLAATSAVLLGHALIFRESLAPLKPATGLTIWRRAAAPIAIVAFTYAIFLIHEFPRAVRAFRFGRVGVAGEQAIHGASSVVFSGLAKSAGLLLPVLITFLVLFIYRRRFALAVFLSLPVFIVQIIVGTRFPLLFSILGAVLVWMAPRRPTRRSLTQLAGVALLLLGLSVLMQKSRAFGLGSVDTANITASADGNALVLNEGVVRMMSLLVKYTHYNDYLYGRSSAAVLVFWIPRAFWPEKPKLLGYWLPRSMGMRLSGLPGFSEGHSVAYSFAGDAFVDFGFYGGIVFWLFGGICFGFIERWVARVCARRAHPAIVTAAPLYGATFFAVRSLDTTLIVISGVVFLGLLFRALLSAPQAAPTEATV